MALETGTYISDLVATNPPGTDDRSTADDHLRLIKSTIKNTFPNITGAVNATQVELNYVDGVTSAIQTQLNAITGANSNITSLSGLTTDITIAQGGTGSSTASGARANLGLGTIALLNAIDRSHLRDAVAGSIVVLLSTTLFDSETTTWTKFKEFKVSYGGVFTVTIEFKHAPGGTGYGKIYVNGSAVGIERSTSSTTYVTFSENITVVEGDLIQWYAKNDVNDVNHDTKGKDFILKENKPLIPVITLE